jgi:hypothetical protein
LFEGDGKKKGEKNLEEKFFENEVRMKVNDLIKKLNFGVL